MNTFLDFLINYYDLAIAFFLLLVIVIVLYLSRINVLPKKSILFVLGALVGVIGIQLLNRFVSRKGMEEIEKLKKELEEIDKELKALREKADVDNESLKNSLDELDKKRIKIKRNVLLVNADDETEKEKIRQMSDEEILKLFNEYISAGQ